MRGSFLVVATPQDEADPPSRESREIGERSGSGIARDRGPRGNREGAMASSMRDAAPDNQDEWASGVASKASASVHVEPDAPQVSVPSSPTSSVRPDSPEPDPALDAA